jgi:phosphatidylglycerophosphatase A
MYVHLFLATMSDTIFGYYMIPYYSIVRRTFFLENRAKPRALDPVENTFEGIAIMLDDIFSGTSKNATIVRNSVFTY